MSILIFFSSANLKYYSFKIVKHTVYILVQGMVHQSYSFSPSQFIQAGQ